MIISLLLASVVAAAPAGSPARPEKKAKSSPAVAESARRLFVKANAVMGDAKTPEDYAEAAKLYEGAAAAAPGWPEPLFNLAKARELRGEFDPAIAALEKYIKADGSDAREAQDLIYALETKRERAAKAKSVEEALVEPGARAGALRLGMSREEAEAKLGPGDCKDLPGAVSCDWRAGKGLTGNFFAGRLGSIEVFSSSYATKEGVRVGSTQAKLREAFGGLLEVREHTLYSTREDALRGTNGRQAVELYKVRGLTLRPSQDGTVAVMMVEAP